MRRRDRTRTHPPRPDRRPRQARRGARLRRCMARRHRDSAGTISTEERLYRLGTLQPPRCLRCAPRSRRCRPACSWNGWNCSSSRRSATSATTTAGRTVRRQRERVGDRFVLWDDDGSPVSMAMLRAPAAGVSRIGPVFTPLDRRGHGYGSAVTAAAAELAQRSGIADVVLFADLANRRPNAIYQRIGFEAVADIGQGRRSQRHDARAARGLCTDTTLAVVGGPRTVNVVAKTNTRTSGRVSNRFWKLLGASTDKDQTRSMAQVGASADFDEKAADLDDEQLKQGRRAAEPRRPGRFGGHPAVPRDRPRGRRADDHAASRSTSSCWARCGCWRATSSRWPPVRARRWPARSPRPATRSAGATCTSSPSTTTWPAATPNGWARCSRRWG